MSLISSIFGRSRLFNDLNEEMRLHIEERTEQLMREGMSRQEAERQARVAFGNPTLMEERSRAVWQWPTLESIWADVAIRGMRQQLRKSPAASPITAASDTDAGHRRQRSRLRRIERAHPASAECASGREPFRHPYMEPSYPDYLDLRQRNRSFDDVAVFAIRQSGLDAGKDPSNVWQYETSGNYFDVLRIQPYSIEGAFLSRLTSTAQNSAPYVVLSYGYWHSHFQDDRTMVGRVVRLNKQPFTILGVTPPGFQGTILFFAPDIFLPIVNHEQLSGEKLLNGRDNHWLYETVGHLKPGVTPAQATADLNSVDYYLKKSYPKEEDNESYSALARPGLHGDLLGGPTRTFLTGLMLLSGLILFAACANLGSLFAARAADRSKEVALRLALGSSRNRILRQLFTESVLLSLAGGAAGLVTSILLLHRLSVWQPFPRFPLHLPVSPDANVYLTALVLALVSGVALFGIVPVRQVLRANPYEIVKAGSTGAFGRRITVRDVLLVVQIAISAVLVTSSMVAVRGLMRSMHSNLGFEPRNVMLVDIDLTSAGYTGERVPAMQRRMIDALQAIPGADSVGSVNWPPLEPPGGWQGIVYTDTTTDLNPSNAAANSYMYNVTPDYFRASGTSLLAGRAFTWHDDTNAPRVAVVNREFASKILGSACRTLSAGISSCGTWHARAGGGPGRRRKIREPHRKTQKPAMFFPLLQSPAELDMAGGVVEPRPARELSCRGHEKCAPGHRPRDGSGDSPVEHRNGWIFVPLAHGDSITGCAGRDGGHAVDYRHLRDGGTGTR